MQKRLLYVEDALESQVLVKRWLEDCCCVYIAESVEHARNLLTRYQFDLILLDIHLPDGDGLDLLSNLKSELYYEKIPIIVLSAKNETADQILAIELGAEDFISKDTHPLLIKTKIKVRLERMELPSLLVIGDIRIGTLDARVTHIGQKKDNEINLTPIEFRIIIALARCREQIVSRDQMIEQVWPDHVHIVDRVVDSHISRIRKKLKLTRVRIESIHGMGYRIKVDRQLDLSA